jgi:branched-chain amino acid transport system permease protein
MAGAYAIISVGLNMIFGVANVVNFAYGALMMWAMYGCFLLNKFFGIDPYLTLILLIPLFFFFGYGLQIIFFNPLLDKPHVNQLLVALGLLLMLENAALLTIGPDPEIVKTGTSHAKIILGSFIFNTPRLIAFAGAFAATVLLFLLLKRTMLGKAIRAIADQPEGALAVGIPLKRMYCIVHGIAAVCAALAGALIIPFYYVKPDLGAVFTVTAFIIVGLGGMGNIIGGLVGSFIIGVTEAVAVSFMPGSSSTILVFLIFIIFLVFRPRGIFGKS